MRGCEWLGAFAGGEVPWIGMRFGLGFGLDFLGNHFLESHDKLNAASGHLAFL